MQIYVFLLSEGSVQVWHKLDHFVTRDRKSRFLTRSLAYSRIMCTLHVNCSTPVNFYVATSIRLDMLVCYLLSCIPSSAHLQKGESIWTKKHFLTHVLHFFLFFENILYLKIAHFLSLSSSSINNLPNTTCLDYPMRHSRVIRRCMKGTHPKVVT